MLMEINPDEVERRDLRRRLRQFPARLREWPARSLLERIRRRAAAVRGGFEFHSYRASLMSGQFDACAVFAQLRPRPSQLRFSRDLPAAPDERRKAPSTRKSCGSSPSLASALRPESPESESISTMRETAAPCRSMNDCTSSSAVARASARSMRLRAAPALRSSLRSPGTRRCSLPGSFAAHRAEHWRVPGFQDLAIAQVHVDAARQARIKAAHRAHDVDAFEFIRPVLLEDRRVLHRIFVRTRSSVNVARVGIPASRRIRMIVGDLAVANHDVMREHAAHRFVEAAGQ